jgi:transcriptional regulator with XRE-family HTH domain
MQRAELARRLGASPKTITNLYRRETPDGVNDVFLARMAVLLDMTEPELLVKWKEGLPEREGPPARDIAAAAPKKSKAKGGRK